MEFYEVVARVRSFSHAGFNVVHENDALVSCAYETDGRRFEIYVLPRMGLVDYVGKEAKDVAQLLASSLRFGAEEYKSRERQPV